jgi:hypothetical protein
MNTQHAYKGKHKRSSCVKIDKQKVTTYIYHSDNTVIQTVDSNGNVETSIEPP